MTMTMNKLLCLVALFGVITSCERGIDLKEIEAMKAGAVKDSALLYYHHGLQIGEPLQAMQDFELREKPTEGDSDIAVNKGDTLIPTGIMTPPKGSIMVKMKAIRGGKIVAEGWKRAGSRFAEDVGPLAWSALFFNWSDWSLSLLILCILVIVLHRGWKWLYVMIQNRRRKSLCTNCRLKFKPFYYISASFAAFILAYIACRGGVASSLYYHPDIFAHWSEYPFIVKLLPIAVALLTVAIVGLFIEMIVKMKSVWIPIPFIGTLARGVVMIVALVMLFQWIF